MKTIYYLFGILPIIFELFKIAQLDKVYLFLNNFKKDIKKDYSEWNFNQKTYNIFMSLYLLWVILGLFTSNWILFLFIILISLIPTKTKLMLLIDGIVSFLILTFIIVNTFHLHIDLQQLLLNIF